MAYGVILGQSFGKGLNAKLYVNATSDTSSLTEVKATGVNTGNVYNGVYNSTLQYFIIDIPVYDVYTVSANLSGQTILPIEVTVDTAERKYISLAIVSNVLNDSSWATIGVVSDMNMGESLWSVGDTKEIIINGQINDGLTLDNYSTYVYILGFNHNETLEGQGITFGGFKSALSGGKDIALVDSDYNNSKTSGTWFNMNNTSSNAGGWEQSRMRTVLIPQFKNCLESDLVNVLKTVTKYSDNTGGGSNTASYVTSTTDTIFLLAEYEVFGTRSYANSAEQNYQAQYQYYKNGNSKVKYRHSATVSTASWWLRSVRANYSPYFCRVMLSGSADSFNAYYSYGFAPAFVV